MPYPASASRADSQLHAREANRFPQSCGKVYAKWSVGTPECSVFSGGEQIAHDPVLRGVGRQRNCAKVAAVKTDPKANHLLLDYVAMTERFGFLDFSEFVILWHAADAMMEAGLEAGFEPQDMPELLIALDE